MNEEMLKGKTILVVDDENDLREIVASELEFMGAKVFQAENITRARDTLKRHPVDLVLSDIRMPGGTGIDLLESIKDCDPQFPPVILITGFADITVEEAHDRGAEALINKPFNLDDLILMAARFVRPVEERFSEQLPDLHKEVILEFQQSLPELLAAGLLKFGRGGMALQYDSRGRRIDFNEPLNFHFKFADRDLKGQLICRWRVHMDESSLVKVGLEFLYLDKPSLIYFLQQTRATPYLPAL